MKPGISSKGLSITLGILVFLASILVFALGGVTNEASGRGPEVRILSIGKERASDVMHHDHLRLGDLGWITGRGLNRWLGEHTGLGNNAWRGWSLIGVCMGISVTLGFSAFYLTHVLISLTNRRKANKAAMATPNRGLVEFRHR